MFGDTVKPGDMLIEGAIIGKYTGTRYVHADGDVYAKICYSKEEEADFKQSYFEATENTYSNFRINFNNFEINFNKRLPNFKNYDTIETKKKLKFFSNFYIPIELKKVVYKEKNLKHIEYTVEELSEQLQKKLKKELLSQNNISEENLIQVIPVVTPTENGVKLKLTCETEEKIGVLQQLVN